MHTETRIDGLVDRWEQMRDGGMPPSVEELCNGCPELVAEVRRRIEALRAMDSALDTDVRESRPTDVGRDPGGLAGFCGLPELSRASAVYRVGGHHGHGGLGLVLVAHQEELDRTVALKRIRPDKAREATRRRFLREAVLTARLQHPGIVPIYGLGRDDGGPFYTMPLIRGQTFQQAIAAFHADDSLRGDPGLRGLRLRGLLQRLISACQTMAYAHDQGVVHRDLKPSNIMLGPYGETLVMDWGLAKRCVDDEAEGVGDGDGASPEPSSEELTATGEVVGTPLYMSPEQSRGEPAGPAADIFSLGLILHAILTGRSAFEGRGARGADGAEALRRAAIVPPRRWDPLLPRALEAICLKATSARPEDRYRSARDLADDLNRWLADEPVSVGREPISTRARRWGRRHRPVVAASIVGLAVGVIGLGAVSVVQARANDRLEKARDDVAGALVQSEESRKQAETVSRFLVQAFRSADPSQIDRDVKVVDVLDRACEQVDREFSEVPATRGALLDALGKTYDGLGSYDRAVGLLTQARAAREAALGLDHPDTLSTLNALALAHQSAMRLPEAIALHRECLGRAEARLGRDDPRTLTSLSNLAAALHFAGRNADAIAMIRETLARREARLGPDHPDTLDSRNNLAVEYWSAGRLEDAIVEFEGTLKARQIKLGMDHPTTLRNRANLAFACYSAGRIDDAIALFETVIEQQGVKLGPDHPETLATDTGLANAYQAVGRLTDAIALHEATLGRREARLGRDNPFTLASRKCLAACYAEAGRIAEAIELYEATLGPMGAKLGSDNPDTLDCRCNLANSYTAAGRLREAIALHESTLKLRESKLGPDHFGTLASRIGLATAYRVAGRPVQAAALHESALRPLEARVGLDHHDTLEVREELASDYDSLGERGKAEGLYRDALARRRKSVRPDSPLLARDLVLLARNLLDQERASEAEPLLREGLTILEKVSPDDWSRYDAMGLLGAARLGRGRHSDAESLVIGGYEGMKAREPRIPIPDRSEIRRAAERIVRLYEDWGRPERAAAWKIKVGMPDLPADVFARP